MIKRGSIYVYIYANYRRYLKRRGLMNVIPRKGLDP